MQKRFGASHEFAASTASYANVRATGELEEATQVINDALERYQTHFGARHPLTLLNQVNKAVLMRAQGQLAAARTLDEVCYGELSEVLGPDHPYTICAGVGLATDHARAGEHQEALALSTAMYELSKQTSGGGGHPARDGGEHPYVLMRGVNLSIDMRATGDREGADALFAQSLDGLRQVLGSEHPEVIAVEQGARTEGDIEPPPTDRPGREARPGCLTGQSGRGRGAVALQPEFPGRASACSAARATSDDTGSANSSSVAARSRAVSATPVGVSAPRTRWTSVPGRPAAASAKLPAVGRYHHMRSAATCGTPTNAHAPQQAGWRAGRPPRRESPVVVRSDVAQVEHGAQLGAELVPSVTASSSADGGRVQAERSEGVGFALRAPSRVRSVPADQCAGRPRSRPLAQAGTRPATARPSPNRTRHRSTSSDGSRRTAGRGVRAGTSTSSRPRLIAARPPASRWRTGCHH
jgi:hypothetical protein